MSQHRSSLDPSYFERLYQTDPDPWKFASSDYEQQKYAATLSMIPRRRIDAAFEIGCSIGILTKQLAPLCQSLLAVDVAEAALAQAREHCKGIDHIRFRRLQVPGQWPSQRFDLILMSEVLYYFSLADISAVADRARHAVTAGGHVLLVHWTGETDYPCGGDQATEAFAAAVAPWMPVVRHHRTAQYRIDLFVRQ